MTQSFDPPIVRPRVRIQKLRSPWERSIASAADMPHKKAVLVSVLLNDFYNSAHWLNLSPRTKRTYQNAFNRIELIKLVSSKGLFNTSVHKVTYATIDYIHAVMLHSYSPAYIKLIFSTMSCVWEHALRTGRAAVNPWLRNKVKVDNQRDMTWTSANIKDVVNYAKEMGDDLLAAYVILLYETGQRPWEDIRDLKWENYVTYEDGKKYLDFIISKTDVHLILPLSDEATSVIDAMPRLNDYIMVDEHGNRPSGGSMGLRFTRVRRALRLPDNLQIRDIRRTVVTEMAQAGATHEQIRAVTGWKSLNILTRYARVRLPAAVAALDKLNAQRKAFKEGKPHALLTKEEFAEVQAAMEAVAAYNKTGENTQEQLELWGNYDN